MDLVRDKTVRTNVYSDATSSGSVDFDLPWSAGDGIGDGDRVIAERHYRHSNGPISSA